MLHCAPCTDVCCTGWYDLLSGLLDVCHTAVESCGTTDCCDGWAKFVSVAEPSVFSFDYVAGWISDVSVTVPGPAVNAGTRPRATLNIKLHETGWPTIEATVAGEVMEPRGEEYSGASLHSYAHAQAMFHAAYAYLTQTCHTTKAINAMRPLGPSGGGIGWTFAAIVEL